MGQHLHGRALGPASSVALGITAGYYHTANGGPPMGQGSGDSARELPPFEPLPQGYVQQHDIARMPVEVLGVTGEHAHLHESDGLGGLDRLLFLPLHRLEHHPVQTVLVGDGDDLVQHRRAQTQRTELGVDGDANSADMAASAGPAPVQRSVADDLAVDPRQQRQRPVVVQLRRPSLDDLGIGDVLFQVEPVFSRNAPEEVEQRGGVVLGHRLQDDVGAPAQRHLLRIRRELINVRLDQRHVRLLSRCLPEATTVSPILGFG